MHLCRNALQKLVPLTHRGAAAVLRNGSVRQMSSSSVPGSSGDALPYYLLVGVSVAGGGFYAYRTLSRDRERFQDRHEYIHTQLRPAFEAPETKSGTEEASTSSETIEEAVESAIEEVAAEAITDQEGAPSAPVEEDQTKAEDEAAPAHTQEEPEPSTEAASEPSTEATAELEPEPSTEAASEQVESESIESVSQTLEETSPVLETSSENITEELVEAAEDWPELTARKPEEIEVESVPADPEIEIEEAVESEQASASS